MARGGSWSKLSRKAKQQRSAGAWASNYALPSGVEPTILVDFKNGIYLVEAEAVVLSNVLEASENYSGWNPADVTAGVGYNGGSFRLKKALFASLGAGCTMVVRLAAEGFCRIRLMDDPASNNMFPQVIDAWTGRLQLSDGGGTFINDDIADFTPVPMVAAINGTFARLAGSINGRPNITFDVTYDASAHPFDTSVVTGGVIESVGWYPLQDEADLPELSAL